MSAFLERLLDDILRREGSEYTDDPVDAGGPTKYGITQGALSAWRGEDCEPYQVATLTEEEARQIYTARYVQPFLFIQDVPLIELCVDAGVNHGVSRSMKWLQAAAGVQADGVAGPRTREAVLAAPAGRLYCGVLASRARLYGRIIQKDPTQARFAAGWGNRLAEFIENAWAALAPRQV